MDPAQPFFRSIRYFLVVKTQHGLPSVRVENRVGAQVPVPESVVGAARGEGVALFALAERLLGFFALRDVAGILDHVREPPVRRDNGVRIDLKPHPAAVGGKHELVLGAGVAREKGLLNDAVVAVRGPAVKRFIAAAANQTGGLRFLKLRVRFVRPDDAIVAVEDAEGVVDAVKDVVQERLGPCQGGCRLFALGDLGFELGVVFLQRRAHGVKVGGKLAELGLVAHHRLVSQFPGGDPPRGLHQNVDGPRNSRDELQGDGGAENKGGDQHDENDHPGFFDLAHDVARQALEPFAGLKRHLLGFRQQFVAGCRGPHFQF